MNHEERTIESMEKALAHKIVENAGLEKELRGALEEVSRLQLENQKLSRRAYNAEQHAHLADSAIKQMEENQDLLRGQIEKLNALQTIKPLTHGEHH